MEGAGKEHPVHAKEIAGSSHPDAPRSLWSTSLKSHKDPQSYSVQVNSQPRLLQNILARFHVNGCSWTSLLTGGY